MSRLFNGTSDNVVWDSGDVVGTGAITIAVVAKLAGGSSTWNSMLGLYNASDFCQLELLRRGTSDTLSFSRDRQNTIVDTTLADWTNASGWCVVVVSKAAGTVEPDFTIYPIGGSPTHGGAVGDATVADSAAWSYLSFGHFEGADWFSGRVAAIAIWDEALSQADRASLGSTLTRDNWLSIGTPKFLVDELDGFVIDYAGTATRTSIAGTTNDTDDPPGWDSWANDLIKTDLGAWDSASSFGTGPFTTGSFTPPDNSLLVVACSNMRNSGTNTTLGRPTITDSTTGGPLNWVEVDFANLTPFFSTQMTVWYAEVVTGESMTISFDDPDNFNMFAYQACVFAFENYDPANPIDGVIDSGTTNIADGSHSLTLGVAPSVDDYSLIFLHIDADGVTAVPTLDTGWTKAFDQGSDTGGGIIVGLHRKQSTSTTCLVSDVYAGAGSFFKGSMLALNVNVATGVNLRPVTAPTNLWDYAGILLFDLTGNSGDMDNILDWCVENKFKWVCLQCFNDTTLIEQSQIPTWKAAIQSRDLVFGLWGVHHDDPSGDAGRASSQINLWEAEFYIANAETEYKTDGPGTRAHSATFVNAYRALQPDIPSALCTYGAIGNDVGVLGDVTNVNAGVMDLKTWYDAGFHFTPQAYASDPVYELHRINTHARRCRIPMNKFHPMIGIYDGGSTYDGADYRTFMQGLVNTEWLDSLRNDLPVVLYTLGDSAGTPLDLSGNAQDITTVVGTPDYLSTGILDRVSSIRMTGGETLSRAVVDSGVNNIAMEMLFQIQAIGANDQKIFYNGNSGTNGWGLTTSVDGSFRGLMGGVAFMATETTFVIDTWYYFVLTREAGTWKYYVNGTLINGNASGSAPGTPSGTLQIGDSSIQLNCCMFAQHELALTAQQIAKRWEKFVAGPAIGPNISVSPYGFSLFLGETGGTLGAVVEQDYIDLGLAIVTDRAAEAAALERQALYISSQRMVRR